MLDVLGIFQNAIPSFLCSLVQIRIVLGILIPALRDCSYGFTWNSTPIGQGVWTGM